MAEAGQMPRVGQTTSQHPTFPGVSAAAQATNLFKQEVISTDNKHGEWTWILYEPDLLGCHTMLPGVYCLALQMSKMQYCHDFEGRCHVDTRMYNLRATGDGCESALIASGVGPQQGGKLSQTPFACHGIGQTATCKMVEADRIEGGKNAVSTLSQAMQATVKQ
eukprot:1140025-Pelagomonas_calceolata.AAC.2